MPSAVIDSERDSEVVESASPFGAQIFDCPYESRNPQRLSAMESAISIRFRPFALSQIESIIGANQQIGEFRGNRTCKPGNSKTGGGSCSPLGVTNSFFSNSLRTRSIAVCTFWLFA